MLITWLIKLPVAWWLAMEMSLGAVGAWLGLLAELAVLSWVCWLRIKSGRWLDNDATSIASDHGDP